MRLTAIKEGRWYQTKAGLGEALKVGGVHPPAVKMHIVSPLPRGVVWVPPRDVLSEVEAPERAEEGRDV